MKKGKLTKFNAVKMAEDFGIDICGRPVHELDVSNAVKKTNPAWVTEETQAAVRRWFTREPEMPSLRSDYYDDYDGMSIITVPDSLIKKKYKKYHGFIVTDSVKVLEDWLALDSCFANICIEPEKPAKDQLNH